MANYRRFVAYLYEYENNHKGENCGVVRIEAHGKNCQITLQMKCPNLPEGIPITIYGFVRKNKELLGVLLGRTFSGAGGVSGKIRTAADHMGNSEYALPQLGGLLLTTPQQRVFATQWDDRPIYPQLFYVPDSPPEAPEKTTVSFSNAVAKPSEAEVKEPIPEKTAATVSDTDEQEVHIASEEAPGVPTKPVFPTGFPTVEPFNDEEFTECIRLTLEDLPALTQAGFPISVNQFLLHGVHNYKHLLLCKNEKKQLYIIGIPGVFDIREQFMANLFGFTGFKEATNEKSSNHAAFGYWYRPLQV